MNVLAKPIGFLKEVRAELGKVAWSSRKEVLDSTVVVIITTAIMGVLIGAFDLLLSKILTMIFRQ